MRKCLQCSAEVVIEARFCPHCGKSLPAEEEDAPTTVADPFSHTMPADPEELDRVRALIAKSSGSDAIPIRERRAGTTKPIVATPSKSGPSRTLESSVVAEPTKERESEPKLGAKPDAALRVSAPSPISPRAETNMAPSLQVGANVRVMWSDGNAYPATIAQVAPTHILVRFPNGQTQWVESKFLLPG